MKEDTMTEHEMYELLSLLDRQGKAGVPNCAEAAAEIRNLQSELATAQEIRSKGMTISYRTKRTRA